MAESADAGGRLCVSAAGACLPLDSSSEIAAVPGTKATFGIRPEDIALLPPGGEAAAAVDAAVTMV